ncbi:hypothetical protein C8R47DRAFT_1294636 [Mycena vitilis]|nr:hypothetical protein C8R47DRAFT_1294636 [Mycena vitilis]
MFLSSQSVFANSLRCIQAVTTPRLYQRAMRSTVTCSTGCPGLLKEQQLSFTQPGAKQSFIPGDVKTWHRAKVLPQFWSCDWEKWDRRHHKAYRKGHLSTAQMQKGWGISGVVEPLAYVPEDSAPGAEMIFVFVADGVYYTYTYLRLCRFKGPFADRDDFLRRLNDDELWDGESELDSIAPRPRSPRASLFTAAPHHVVHNTNPASGKPPQAQPRGIRIGEYRQCGCTRTEDAKTGDTDVGVAAQAAQPPERPARRRRPSPQARDQSPRPNLDLLYMVTDKQIKCRHCAPDERAVFAATVRLEELVEHSLAMHPSQCAELPVLKAQRGYWSDP